MLSGDQGLVKRILIKKRPDVSHSNNRGYEFGAPGGIVEAASRRLEKQTRGKTPLPRLASKRFLTLRADRFTVPCPGLEKRPEIQEFP